MLPMVIRYLIELMGNERKTIQNLKHVKTDIENNLLFVKGAVPGPTGSILKITKSVKYS